MAGVVQHFVNQVLIERHSTLENAQDLPLIHPHHVQRHQCERQKAHESRAKASLWNKNLIHVVAPSVNDKIPLSNEKNRGERPRT